MDIYQWAESFGASVLVTKVDRQPFDREDSPLWRAYILHRKEIVRIYHADNPRPFGTYEISYFGFGYTSEQAIYHLCDNVQGRVLEIRGHTENIPAILELDGESI